MINEHDIINILFLLFSIINLVLFHIIIIRYKFIKILSHQGFLIKIILINLFLFNFAYSLFFFYDHDSFNILYLLKNNLILFSLSYFYFHFYNLSETSRRIKILINIYKFKKINTKKFEKIYDSNYMISNRIKRLIHIGEIKYKNKKYYLSSYRFLILAKIFKILNKLYITNEKN